MPHSPIMAGSTLYDSYKQRLSGARQGTYQTGDMGQSRAFAPVYSFIDEKTPILSDLSRDAANARIDSDLAKAKVSTSKGITGARGSFAAGRASGQKKVFKGKSSGAFSALGRLEKANIDTLATKAKESSDLDSLLGASLTSTSTSFGPQFKLW